MPERCYKQWPHAVLLAGLVLALVLVVLLQPQGDHDTTVYFDDARAFWHSSARQHALPQEYPLLALVPFSLTLLPFRDPSIGFELGMVILVLAGYLAYCALVAPRMALLYLGYLLLGAQVMMLMRFDIVPALCTLGALWAAQRQRYVVAYALLALGTLVKLYPIALVPLVLIAEWRQLSHVPIKRWLVAFTSMVRWRGIATFGLIVALGWTLAWWLNPAQVWNVFRYAGDRPAQAESLPATLLWLATWVGLPAAPNFAFSSFNLTGPLAGTIITACLALGGLSGIWICWRFARGRMTLSQAFLVLLCVLLVSNKVFSMQYLIWVLPFVPEVEGISLLWGIIAALTTVDLALFTPIPLAPPLSVTEIWPWLCVVAFRNVLLVVATARLLVRPSTGSVRQTGIPTTEQVFQPAGSHVS